MIESGTDVAGGSYEYGTGEPDLEQESFVFVEESSEPKDIDGSNLLAELFHNGGLNGEVPEEVNQVPENPVDDQLGTHFLASQSPDFREPPSKRPRTEPSNSVKCDKCHRTIKADEFQAHYRDVHLEPSADASTNQFKVCSLCNRTLSRKDYLTHFKDAHTEVRLGCPKCPQTYHSPEMLNLHYRHFHAQPQQEQGQTQKPVQQETNLHQCPLCKLFVQDLERHQIDRHSTPPTGSEARSGSVSGPSTSSRRGSESSFHCDICYKTYRSQREFTNHRRRKDFCKPPPPPPSPEDQVPTKRRIGIIRRSL